MKLMLLKIRQNATYWGVLITLCSIVLLATFSIWYPHGYIVFSDLDFGLDDKTYLKRIYGLFNSQFSSTNFFNLSRLTFTAPIYGLARLIGSDLYPHFLPRAIIVLVLLVSAVSMFRLCEHIMNAHFGRFRNQFHYWGLIIPSLFYALNPWVIIRLQHIFLVVGYAFYPLIIHYFIKLLDPRIQSEEDSSSPAAWTRKQKYNRTSTLWAEIKVSLKIAFYVGLGSASIHYFFYYTITFFAIGLTFVIRKIIRDHRSTYESAMEYFRRFAILSLCIFLFSCYWLVPYIISPFFLSIEPLNVNVTDTLSMFARYSDIKHILYLVSYWWPMFDTNQLLDTPFWVGGGVLLAIIAYTIFYRYGWHFYVRLFTWASLISAVVALGVNTSLIGDLNVYIVTKLPLVGQIFRDPNKLIGPMALFFAVLIGFGVDKLTYFLKNSGYGRIWQYSFVLLLLLCLYVYYRPYQIVFVQNYYAGRDVPEAYSKVQTAYTPGGKIMWIPDMENMTISGGLSTFTWNTEPGNHLIKTSGDFQFYSSQKPGIYQHEGNSGIVNYFHTFMQSLLDLGGGQHLGQLFAWAGFNEVGYHQDVYGQDKRQAYNVKMLDNQNDLLKHYDDGLFKLYTPPQTQADVSASSRGLYATKGLNSLLGVLDYAPELHLKTTETALFWGPQRIQNIPLRENDIIVGDDFADMAFPLLDKKYFSFPFQAINTGNPYIDWAKTLIETPEWSWILKSNNIRTSDWNYDFGEGFVYTYTSHKLPVEPNKVSSIVGTPFVTMKDVIDGFFTADNPNIFKLSFAPSMEQGDAILSGSVTKGLSGPNLWQIAQSKLIQLDPKTRFVRMKTVVSGINASKMHFKIKFFDEKMQELSVSYVSKDNDLAEFSKAIMSGDATVPEHSRFLRIDLLSSDDSTKNMYFTIHDLAVSDVTQALTPNTMTVPINDKKVQPYHTFVRVFQSLVGGDLTIQGLDRTIHLSTKGEPNHFVWLDLGALQLNGKVFITADSGLNIVNTIVTIPVSSYDGLMRQLSDSLRGKQADISLISNDYAVKTALDFKPLQELRTYPNTLAGSLIPITEGSFTKKIDILHDGIYRFDVNGWIPSSSSLQASLQSSDGTTILLTRDMTPPKQLDRNLKGMFNQIKYEVNQYFLNLVPNTKSGWDVYRYSFQASFIPKGTYTIVLSAKSNQANSSRIADLHLLEANEINVPNIMIDSEEELLTYALISREQLSIKQVEKTDLQSSFTNNATSSPQWIILTLNPVPVKKNDLIIFRAKLNTENVKNLHSKMMFLDGNSNLIRSDFARNTDQSDNEFSLIAEAPADGFMQPSFFYNGTKAGIGKVTLIHSDLYTVDKLIKLESTALLPTDLEAGNAAKIKGNVSHFQTENSRFVVYNEAFNPIWTMNGQTPIAVNLLHNGYIVADGKTNGSIQLKPLLNGMYYFFLMITILAHLTMAALWLRWHWRRRKV